MKFIATLTATVALSALLTAPVQAGSRGFDSDIQTKLSEPIKIEVVLSEDLAYRADNLPRDLSDRSGARGLRSGFSGNGYYGEDALAELKDELREDLDRDFAKRGIAVSDTASTILRVTIVDARNNRPTHRQLSVQPNLGFGSFGNGGAELSGELIGANGEDLGTMEYRWFDTRLDEFDYGSAIWGDARQAFRRFSRRASKALT